MRFMLLCTILLLLMSDIAIHAGSYTITTTASQDYGLLWKAAQVEGRTATQVLQAACSDGAARLVESFTAAQQAVISPLVDQCLEAGKEPHLSRNTQTGIITVTCP
jgi:hypothetical protein